VRIGAGATIGAGSTITASTPEHKLTLERSRQAAVDGWQRPVKMSDAERRAIIDEAMNKKGAK
jgi:bifunctional UDP-N-acetylglucosamine pyrophosphorylase/glucosamine-1-phosphate N-acetyltransferase